MLQRRSTQRSVSVGSYVLVPSASLALNSWNTHQLHIVHRLTVSLLLYHQGEQATEWLVGDTTVLATED